MWLTTRRYFGTVLDSRFYMVEALHALHPSRFAEDLYFKFGSQGNFSFFPKFYLPLLPVFGIGMTSLILTVAGQLLWLFALFRLARSLVGERLMWLSVAMVIGMSNIYIGGFGYGEAYATARLFTEAVVMLALAFLPTRPFWSIALLVLSAGLHPLMALPGIAIAFVYLALGQPIWWAAMGAGAVLAAALGLAGIAPFSNLFRIVDPQWFAVINVRCSYCLLGNWTTDYFKQIFGATAWAFAALVTAGPAHRRFLIATFLASAGGIVCAFLGGDIAHNAFALEIQTWRSVWPLQIVSRIYIPLVFLSLLARTSLDRFRWATLLTMVPVLALSAAELTQYPNSLEFTPGSFVLVAAALAVMAAQLLLVEQKHRHIAMLSALAGFALIPVALSRWDARTPWVKYLESPEPPPKNLAALLPGTASVYWESGPEMAWFKLKRPSYFSCDQGTGIVFSRETAMAYKHRADSFWPLRTDDFAQLNPCTSLDMRPTPQRNRKGLHDLCFREPELGYVVLRTPLDGVTAKAWQSPVPFQNAQGTSRVTDRFYVYSCVSVR